MRAADVARERSLDLARLAIGGASVSEPDAER